MDRHTDRHTESPNHPVRYYYIDIKNSVYSSKMLYKILKLLYGSMMFYKILKLLYSSMMLYKILKLLYSSRMLYKILKPNCIIWM